MKKLLIIFAVLFIAISAFAQIPGSTYENPLPVTLPLSGYTGDTSLYGDDYESGWVSPSFNYLGGDDMVLEFTLAEDSYLSGTLASTDGGTWIGMCVVNQAPDSANPAPTFARASSSGSSATMAATALPAGTYALIISTWPTPQSFQFTLDLIATPVPTTPELSVTPDQWSFGNLNINNTASKLFTLSNTGGGSLSVSNVTVSGTYFSLTEAFTPISLGLGESTTFTVEYTPTSAGTHTGTITINDNRAVTTINLNGTATDPTISTFPWIEDFGTVSGDWPVQDWTQRSGLYPTPTGTSTQWVRDEWLNGPTGNNAAKINIYGSSRYGWLVTPPIAIPATGYELMFDLGLTRYGNTTAVDPLQQSDDKFIVAISDSPDMSNPTLLKEWNNIGSADVFNDIPNTGTMVIIDLDAHPGLKYIAFYGESTATGGDNDLFVDNVSVRESPLNPIISINPDAWDYETQIINTTTPKEFTITNTGAGSLDVSSISVTGTGFALAAAFSPVSLLTGESASFMVNFAPVAEGTYSGNIAINSNIPQVNIVLDGAALDATIYAGDLPHFENFDAVTAPAFPLGWEGVINSTNTSVKVETYTSSTPYSAPNHVYIYNSGDATADLILVSPPVDVALNTLRTKFMAKGGSSYSLDVGTWDGTTFTLYENLLIPANYAMYSVNFSGYTGSDNRIAFRHGQGSTYRSIYLDDVVIEVPAPVAPEPATVLFPADGITTLLNPMLQWTPSPTGEPAISYKVYMNETGNFTGQDPVYEGTDLQYQTTGLLNGRTYYWKVLPLNVHGSDPTCPTWTFNTPGTDQLAEGFEATAFPPVGWANGSTGNWTRSTSTPKFEGDASAYKFTSTSTAYVLSTPMLTIDGSSTVDFYTRATATSQVLKVVYSEDRTTWTQVGADITYAATGIWYPISINLSTLAGNYYIGFQTPTQTTSGSIYVDHVIGPNITPLAPDAPTLSAPNNAATNQSPNPKLTWTAATTGGIPTGYNIYLDTNAEPITLIGTSTTTSYDVNTALNWGDTYYWKVEATNVAGTSIASAVRSFTIMSDPTIYDLPYLVDFGTVSADWPVTNWTQLNGLYPTPTGTSAQWFQGNWINVATPLNKAAKINIYGASRNGWLVTPPIAIPADGHELRFDLGLTKYNNAIPIEDDTAQEDDKFMVLVSDSANMSNATILQEWNNAGSSNVFNAIPHTGTTVIIDLTGHTGAKYFAFYGESTITGNGDNDLFVDNVMVRETPIGRPDPVTLVSPADEATMLPVEGFTLNWTPAITGGTPSSYKVYLDTNPDPGTLIATETGFTHEIVTPLAYGSTYYWKVIAHNSSGDADASTIFSFETVPEGLVIIGDGTADNKLPVSPWHGYTYSQTIYPQASINMADQRIEKISYYWNGAGAGPNSGGWTVYMGHTSAATFASTSDWVPLTELSQVFTGNVTIPATAGWIEIPLQTPFLYNNTDNLVIAVDENTSGYDGSTYYFHNTNVSTNVSIKYQNDSTNPDPATPPTGTLVSAYPNIMMQLGDIPTGAPGPVTLISPENEATNLPIEGFNLTWALNLTGGYPETYAVLMSMNEGDLSNDHYWDGITDTSFDPTQAELNPIAYEYGETWYWTVIALNEDGDALQETASSFTIMDDPRILSLPYSENFDGVSTPDLPVAWTAYVDATTTYAYIDTYSSTSYAVSQPNAARLTNSSDTSADLRLITPDILVPINSIKLSFSARGSSGYTLLVGTVDALDETGTFTQLASIDLSANHEIYSVSFASYAGTDQNICFKHGLGGTYRSIYIDDVMMEELVANDLAVTAFSGDSYGIAGDELSYNVSVYNNGTAEASSYSIELLSLPTHNVLASVNISTALASEATVEHAITWTPANANVYNVYAKVVLIGDANSYNDESDPMTVGVYSATSYIPFIGDPESTNTINSIPFNMYWKNNVAETIYMAHEMQMASGTINAITYHNNFVTDLTLPVKIWMAHTTESVNEAWLPFEDYELVFDGNVHFPIGVNAIVIPLQTSFQYTGGNLAVRTNRVHMGECYSSSDKFYYTSDSNYPNRTRYFQSDSTVYDPTDPGADGAGSRNSNIPNTAFIVDPYTAMPPLSAPALQIELSGSNPQLSWEAVAGAFNYVIYGSNDPYNWAEATEIATTTNLTYNISSAPAMKFYKVAARSYNHQVRDIGQVFNPAAVIGFDNSAVKVMPVIPSPGNKD